MDHAALFAKHFEWAAEQEKHDEQRACHADLLPRLDGLG
jgi:hypothetical protein